jgi:hypothetical protein
MFVTSPRCGNFAFLMGYMNLDDEACGGRDPPIDSVAMRRSASGLPLLGRRHERAAARVEPKPLRPAVGALFVEAPDGAVIEVAGRDRTIGAIRTAGTS